MRTAPTIMSKEQPRPTHPTILLLDDDEEILKLLDKSLAQLPCRIVAVGSGLDALREIFKAYKAGKPFVGLVLDCALPNFDGFTIAKIVRTAEESGLGPRTKIAFFTAFGDTVERSTLLQEVGADAYWRKPEDVVELPRMITEWLKNEITNSCRV